MESLSDICRVSQTLSDIFLLLVGQDFSMLYPFLNPGDQTKQKGEAAMSKYQPYTGPAGPSAEQVHQNNVALAAELAKHGRVATIAKEVPPLYCEEVELVSLGKVKVGYDRWGFVSEGIEQTIDQVGLHEAVIFMLANA